MTRSAPHTFEVILLYLSRSCSLQLLLIASSLDVDCGNGAAPVELLYDRLHSLLSDAGPDECIHGSSIRPELIRIAPPLLPCATPDEAQGELVWLSPHTVKHNFHWDPHVSETNPTSEVSVCVDLWSVHVCCC